MDDAPSPTLRYFFDPLCGWCYAAAPALAGLAQAFGARLRMMPTGLFTQPRPVALIADHAWRNDQRISAMTGQPFSEAYHHTVLLAPGGVFDSTALTRALVALGEQDASLEPAFLHHAQIARYVDGIDTSVPDAVAALAAAVAREAGIAIGADAMVERLISDAALARATDARVGEAQAAMQALGIRGVPQLVVDTRGHHHVIDGADLYAEPGAQIDRLAAPAVAN